MQIKKIIFLALLIFAIAKIHCQNYQISFTGIGVTNTIDSVKIINLIQCTSLTIPNGSDTLHLIGTTGINSSVKNHKGLAVYPNPMNHSCKIEFYNSQPALVSIEVFDVAGKILIRNTEQLQRGIHTYSVTGLKRGVYFLQVSTPDQAYASRIISLEDASCTAAVLRYESSNIAIITQGILKSTKAIFQMSYNDGELLLFEGFSGNYPSVLRTLIPTQSQILDFNFVLYAITGTSTVCQGQNGIAFSVANVSGVTYTWSYSGSGFSVASGQGTDSITADFSGSATPGTLIAIPSHACGYGTARTLSINVVNSIPAAPTANAPGSITQTSFSANWTASTGAIVYYLDVSTDSNFSSFVAGYNNLNAGNATSYSVTGLTSSTSYYYRLRAGNPCGTSGNSDTISVITSAGNPSPYCGSQVWAPANINAGTMINSSTSQTNNAVVEKWCYNNVNANCDTYGGLYQWDEAMNYTASINCDPCGNSGRQGICPPGYHIPTDMEWSRYEWCIETTIAPTGSTPLATFQTTSGWRGSTTVGVGPGDKMKVTSSNNPAWDGTNTSGFAALPGGRFVSGSFSFLGTYAFYRSATESSSTSAWFRDLNTGSAQSYRTGSSKNYGLSVRCLQD